MRPWLAISRKQSLDILNLRRHPRLRPVNWQRLRRRTFEEFFGILFRVSTATRRSSIGLETSRINLLSSCLLSHLFFTSFSRLFCLEIHPFVAIEIPYFLRAGPFWRCFRLGSFLFITYMRPRRRTILSPLPGSALIEALTFILILKIESLYFTRPSHLPSSSIFKIKNRRGFP